MLLLLRQVAALTVICMANTVATVTPEDIRYVTDKRQKECPVQRFVRQARSPTRAWKGQELTDFDALLEAGAPPDR